MNPIYNLVQYLRDEFPAEDFYCNIRENTATQITLPDRCSLIRNTGGPSQPRTGFTRMNLQVLTRDFDVPAAEKLAKDIFDKIHDRYGLILPAALNVGGINYSSLKTAQITAMGLPFNLGLDGAGRTEFTTNYSIIYEET